MALWLVRAGKHGERESYALETGRAVIGWEELPDLSGIESRDEVERRLRDAHPEFQPARVTNHAGQIWAFLQRIETGDLIVLPLKGRSAVAIGQVTGPYEYVVDAPPNIRHGRPVRWLRTDMPRSEFDQDLLHSFGSLLTVFQVTRNDAEARVRRMLEGRPVPRPPSDEVSDVTAEQTLDLGEVAADQIRELIGRKYRGHAPSHLIAGILRAQGYQVHVSPPGPDAGIDILAGSGPMGFDAPRIAVQVKSSDTPVDVSVLRELQGVMPRFGAEQGLIVSWGGFKDSVTREARQLYFRIRLWDSGDLIAALSAHYDDLPDALQAEIPMKQVWVLVEED